jgi:polyisoprenoid-binding protein YceI
MNSRKRSIFPKLSLSFMVFILAACSTSQPVATSIVPGQDTNISGNTAYPAPGSTNTAAGMKFAIVPGESQVSYQVGETLFNQGNVFNLALGVTPQVSGDILIDNSNPKNSTIGPITVDISKFTSDSTLRDNQIRRNWLESSTFPLAIFTPTSIEGLPNVGAENTDYSLRITGDLTVHDVTQPVTFDATIRLSGDTLTGTATTTILMSSFGVGPISIGGILETQDEALLTLTLVARQTP